MPTHPQIHPRFPWRPLSVDSLRIGRPGANSIRDACICSQPFSGPQRVVNGTVAQRVDSDPATGDA
jgi:hypothetical protein